MNITLLVGIFFLVLAGVFGASSARGKSGIGAGPAPAGRVHGRVAIIFALVGAGLLVFHFLGH